MSKLATPAQRAYIASLIVKAGSTLSLPAEATVSEASDLIYTLKAQASSAVPQLVAEGIYRRSSDDAMFRVQTSEQGRRYAKLLLPEGGWGYERGAIYTLKADERLTLAELEAWGISTGVCAICGRLLSTAESVARGIGPVCASRY